MEHILWPSINSILSSRQVWGSELNDFVFPTPFRESFKVEVVSHGALPINLKIFCIHWSHEQWFIFCSLSRCHIEYDVTLREPEFGLLFTVNSQASVTWTTANHTDRNEQVVGSKYYLMTTRKREKISFHIKASHCILADLAQHSQHKITQCQCMWCDHLHQ